jgi:hypothetical protein
MGEKLAPLLKHVIALRGRVLPASQPASQPARTQFLVLGFGRRLELPLLRVSVCPSLRPRAALSSTQVEQTGSRGSISAQVWTS